MSPWEEELDFAKATAREAGRMLRERYVQGRPLKVAYKGVIDLVTEMDRAVERFVRSALHQRFPEHGLLGEEEGGARQRGQPRWLVDPLDGTTNYAHGYPFFAVSLALEVDDQVVVAAVYNPLLDEMFTAIKGEGAYLNDSALQVSTTESLGRSLLASGFPYDAWTNPRDNGREWRRFLKKVVSLRSDGSAALDLCHVAAGRIDGYWELDLEPWDVAAGALIVQEAGGRVTQVNGQAFSPYARSIVASNGRIHEAMLDVLTGEPMP